jgi:hypothetical protein
MTPYSAIRPTCPHCGLTLRTVVAGIVTQAPTAHSINDNVLLTLRVGPTATGMSGHIEVCLNCKCGWHGPWYDLQDLHDSGFDEAPAHPNAYSAEQLAAAFFGC